jgi:hypothetical protein
MIVRRELITARAGRPKPLVGLVHDSRPRRGTQAISALSGPFSNFPRFLSLRGIFLKLYYKRQLNRISEGGPGQWYEQT